MNKTYITELIFPAAYGVCARPSSLFLLVLIIIIIFILIVAAALLVVIVRASASTYPMYYTEYNIFKI